MDRGEATRIAESVYKEYGAVIIEANENNGRYFFFGGTDDNFDPTQAALVIDDEGTRFEACNPATETFQEMMDGKRFI